MNIRPSIVLGAAAIIVASLALVVWSSKRAVRTEHPPTAVESAPATTHPPVQGAQPEGGPVETEGPIVFYGRLEDQGTTPVADAEVVGTLVSWQDGQKTTTQLSTRSDAEGFFKLQGGSGESLEVTAQKPGYALAATNNVERYTQSKAEPPAANRPVILKMWKLQGAEPLATFNQHYRFHYDGPLYFDFVTQMFVPADGDIKLTINRPPGLISATQQPDWSVAIEGTEGGVMEVTPAVWRTTYWAPTDGYQPSQVLLISTNPPQQWAPSLSQAFFVQTRHGGVYTKLLLKIGINLNENDPLELALYSVSNTNGSCNWEGDTTFQQQ